MLKPGKCSKKKLNRWAGGIIMEKKKLKYNIVLPSSIKSLKIHILYTFYVVRRERAEPLSPPTCLRP